MAVAAYDFICENFSHEHRDETQSPSVMLNLEILGAAIIVLMRSDEVTAEMAALDRLVEATADYEVDGFFANTPQLFADLRTVLDSMDWRRTSEAD
jgi:hypothetical protein